jgi:hypothetical protein
MNKRTVMASLNKIANELDNNGLHNEADTVTKVMSRLAYDDFDVRDYHNDKMDGMDLMRDDYMPYGDPDGDDDEDMEDEDYDMGPESEPFDYSSPEDEGDMYGDDMSGYMDKDTDF